jgi:hypothetical protein
MKEAVGACCICGEQANWIRTRMPNGQQMTALCERHHDDLKRRNALLASYYDFVKPMRIGYYPQSSRGVGGSLYGRPSYRQEGRHSLE